MKHYPVVYIEWTDAIGAASGWDDQMTLHAADGACLTCGFLLDENEEFVLVASTVTDGAQQGGMTIPKSMIDNRYEVELP